MFVEESGGRTDGHYKVLPTLLYAKNRLMLEEIKKSKKQISECQY